MSFLAKNRISYWIYSYKSHPGGCEQECPTPIVRQPDNVTVLILTNI
jgi:hypothetical protein